MVSLIIYSNHSYNYATVIYTANKCDWHGYIAFSEEQKTY